MKCQVRTIRYFQYIPAPDPDPTLKLGKTKNGQTLHVRNRIA
jgi:hypothetical protein